MLALLQASLDSAGDKCSLTQGYDCLGLDISNRPAADAGACCDLCGKTAGCKAFTLAEYDGQGKRNSVCYMKSACASKTPKSSCTAGETGPPAPMPFQNASLPWDVRTADLVSRLTLDEKVAQLAHYDVSKPDTSLGRAASPPISRLGVGGYNYGEECNTGIRVSFPQNIGMAATFNRSLLRVEGRAIGLALRAQAFHPPIEPGPNPNAYPGLSCWSPMINIMRHPLWGRNHEGTAQHSIAQHSTA